MHNSCDVACRGNAGSFQLNIEVNNENLPPHTNKYNVGSLKLPADPSWPKIPHRKLAENAGDIIEPPYIVTLTDTPRRSRTIIHTPYQQSKSVTTKNSMINPTVHSRPATLTQTLKRRPGIVDPRFKRVMTVKSHDTTVYPSEQKHDISKDTSCSAHTAPNETVSHSEKLEDAIPERDINMQQVIKQEAEKPDESNCNEGSNPCQTHIITPPNINISTKNSISAEQESNNACVPKVLTVEAQRTEIGCTNVCGLKKNSHNMNKESLEMPQQKCNNKSYCTKPGADTERSKAQKNQDIPNKLSQTKIQYPYSDSESELCQNNQQHQRIHRKCSKYTLLRKDEHNTSYDETTDSDFHVATSHQHATTFGHFHTCSAKNAETKHFSVNYNSEIQPPGQKLQRDTSNLNYSRNEDKNVIVGHTAAMKPQQNISPLECTPITKQRRTAVKTSRKAKSFFQKNARCVIPDSDCTLIWPGSHPKQKYSQENLQKCTMCKKDNVYFSQCRENITKETNAQCPACPTSSKDMVKFKLNQDEPKNKLQSTLPSTHFKQQCDEQIDTSNSLTEDSAEKPTKLSLRTQQLLNKNYWEYYNRLKHKLDRSNSAQQNYQSHTTVCSPDIKKRKCDNSSNDERSSIAPEVQTLEQCSLLSTVINRTLSSAFHESGHALQTKQLYATLDIKSSSDPTAGAQSAIVKKTAPIVLKNTYDDSMLSSTCPENVTYQAENTEDQSLLKLKTIIFFGSLMYALIVFLPMLYEYFFYEEYDEYQNMGYIELAVQYILSSFHAAFGDYFDIINNMFFRSRRNTKF